MDSLIKLNRRDMEKAVAHGSMMATYVLMTSVPRLPKALLMSLNSLHMFSNLAAAAEIKKPLKSTGRRAIAAGILKEESAYPWLKLLTPEKQVPVSSEPAPFSFLDPQDELVWSKVLWSPMF